MQVQEFPLQRGCTVKASWFSSSACHLGSLPVVELFCCLRILFPCALGLSLFSFSAPSLYPSLVHWATRWIAAYQSPSQPWCFMLIHTLLLFQILETCA